MTPDTQGHQVLVEQARQHMMAGQPIKAENRAHEALNMAPGSVEVLFVLATIYLGQGKYGAACNLLMNALANGSENPEIHNNLGNCMRGMLRESDAEACWREGLRAAKRLDHIDPDLFNNMGTICVNAARAEEAVEWCDKCIELKPDHPQAHWNKCLALLELGEFSAGWDLHHWGYITGGRLNKQYDCAPWRGQKVKRLVLFGEQGQGDEMLFASMIPEAMKRCDELILDTHPRLVGIFKRSFSEKLLAIHDTRKSPDTSWIYDHYPIDAKAALGDLPILLRRRLSSFPGFTKKKPFKPFLLTSPVFDNALKIRTDEVAKGRPKVGVTWQGGTMKTHFNLRTPDFALFKTLIKKHPEVEWFSCHYKKGSEQMLQREGVKVTHWQDVIDHLDGLTSLIGQMDLLITVDQTAIHQAGAIGQDCIALIPHGCSWRFPKKAGKVPLEDRTPWYGTDKLRLFRQGVERKWEPVFERLDQELTERFGGANVNVEKSDKRRSDAQPAIKVPTYHARVPRRPVRISPAAA